MIATYGDEFAKAGAERGRTAHVLFHGEGHYEALLADGGDAAPRARL